MGYKAVYSDHFGDWAVMESESPFRVLKKRFKTQRAAEARIQKMLEAEARKVRRCVSCNHDISDYAPGLTLCAICDPDVDDE